MFQKGAKSDLPNGFLPPRRSRLPARPRIHIDEDQGRPAKGTVPAPIRQYPHQMPCRAVALLQIAPNHPAIPHDTLEITLKVTVIEVAGDIEQGLADVL
jgi:hypothetical protein